jgi:hypothetical protein
VAEPGPNRWLRVFWPELTIYEEFGLPGYMFFGEALAASFDDRFE